MCFTSKHILGFIHILKLKIRLLKHNYLQMGLNIYTIFRLWNYVGNARVHRNGGSLLQMTAYKILRGGME